MTCEDILRDEMNAWRSSSTTKTKQLGNLTKNDNGNTGTNDAV